MLSNLFKKTIDNDLKSIYWILVACFWFATTVIFIKEASRFNGTLELIFLRNVFSFALMLIWFPAIKSIKLIPNQFSLHLLRAVIGLVGMLVWFYSVSVLNVTTAIALTYLVPVFTAILASWILKDSISLRRFILILTSFFGAMVIIRPDLDIKIASLLIIFAAFLWSLSNIIIKKLTIYNKPYEVALYSSFLMTVITSFVPFFYDISFDGIIWIIMLAIASNFSHISLSKAFSLAKVSFLLPYDFSRLIFASIFAYIFYNEVLDIYTVIGTLIIVVSSLYITKKEPMI